MEDRSISKTRIRMPTGSSGRLVTDFEELVKLWDLRFDDFDENSRQRLEHNLRGVVEGVLSSLEDGVEGEVLVALHDVVDDVFVVFVVEDWDVSVDYPSGHCNRVVDRVVEEVYVPEVDV
jgi:hypothetical protein